MAEAAPTRSVYRRTGFETDVQRWDFYDVCYRGGVLFKRGRDAEGELILIQHPKEFDAKFAKRKAYTPTLNYTRPVVDKYNAAVTRQEPTRSETDSEDFKAFVAECDLHGRDLNRFLQAQLRYAQTLGDYWTGVLTPDTPRAVSVFHRRANGELPYCISVDPRLVVDEEWAGGELIRIVIKHTMSSKHGFDEAEAVRVFFREWRRETITTYGQAVAGGDIAKTGIEDNPYAASECPIPFFRLRIFGEGEAQISQVAELQKSILNVTSLLIEELYQIVFTRVYIMLDPTAPKDSIEEIRNQVNGPGQAIVGRGITSATHLGPSNAAQYLREERDRLIKEIYRISGLSGGDVVEKRVAESGVKKLLDVQDAEEMATTLAQAATEHENQILGCAASLVGEKPEEWARTQYGRDFSIFSLTAEIERAFKILDQKMLPLDFKRDVARDVMGKFFPNASEDQWKRWEEGITGMVDSAADMLGLTPETEARAVAASLTAA